MKAPIIESIREAALAAFAARPESVKSIVGGANNLVFRVIVGGRDILAKSYFQHPGDNRDRLGAEFGMLDFLWKNGLRCIPEPLFADHARHIGLYQFIEGCRPRPEEIAWPDVDQLVHLLAEMWRLRKHAGAAALPSGSDSSFSMAGFLDNVEGRFRHVANTLAAEAAPGEVHEFIQCELSPTLEAVRKFIKQGARHSGLDLEACLSLEQRTLNPADHGFHNALRGHDGRLTFLDFEYAGWDDPAQMICNACLQPAVPIPTSMQRRFVKVILDRLDNPEDLAARLKLLYPLFGLKWSLIMLNEFLPVSRERRRFAGDRPEDQVRRGEQLKKSNCQVKAVQAYLATPVFFDCLV
ncbi:MAG: phosphotransferase [Kiritimatiellaeota bacterium]|nr:phosphotransferase [Kiritimatiellota bacterium]